MINPPVNHNHGDDLDNNDGDGQHQGNNAENPGIAENENEAEREATHGGYNLRNSSARRESRSPQGSSSRESGCRRSSRNLRSADSAETQTRCSSTNSDSVDQNNEEETSCSVEGKCRMSKRGKSLVTKKGLVSKVKSTKGGSTSTDPTPGSSGKTLALEKGNY